MELVAHSFNVFIVLCSHFVTPVSVVESWISTAAQTGKLYSTVQFLYLIPITVVKNKYMYIVYLNRLLQLKLSLENLYAFKQRLMIDEL